MHATVHILPGLQTAKTCEPADMEITRRDYNVGDRPCKCRNGCLPLQEVGFCHMRIGEGVNSRLQLSGLLAKLCKVVIRSQ